ncbi:MAG: hypothetical protein ACRESG_08020, partial [Gammaproteobacteria bacterium]
WADPASPWKNSAPQFARGMGSVWSDVKETLIYSPFALRWSKSELHINSAGKFHSYFDVLSTNEIFRSHLK